MKGAWAKVEQFDIENALGMGTINRKGKNMPDMHGERRKLGRRRMPRRTYDMLNGMATDEERQQYDRIIWNRYLDTDRRERDRRSGWDRRICMDVWDE